MPATAAPRPNFFRTTICLLAGFLAARAPAPAESVGPLLLRQAFIQSATERPPMGLAESLSVAPLHELRRAAEGAVDQIEAMQAHNAARRLPVQVGFARPLPTPTQVRLDRTAAAAADFGRFAGGFLALSPKGNLVWGTSLRVAEAYRLRLHLTDVHLPAGTRLWVWGLGEEPSAFGLELLGPGRDLWTPSVAGEDLILEVEIPGALRQGASFGFDVAEIGEVFRLGADGGPESAYRNITAPLGECLKDATCKGPSTLDVIAAYRLAVAHLEFIKGSFIGVCTGGLLNDTDDATVIPYLLTANHCFDAQASASTLEAFWDYKTSTCNGSFPNLSTLPKSNGSTLLATSLNTDFTLVRLNSIPGGRTLLGWTTQPLPQGTVLHRISHPMPGDTPFPQAYSRSVVSTTFGPCTGLPRPRFLYSILQEGGTFGGSSGAPVILPGGFVVGQLNGGCGPNPDDGCDTDNAEVDGAFSQTFPSISQFLNPAVPGTPCVPDADTLCIDNQPGDRRFKLEVSWQTATDSGVGGAISTSTLGVTSGGMFYFFGPANPEMLIKILNACSLNNRFWVFYAATTNVKFEVVVTDTQTSAIKRYINPLNNPAPPVQDTDAFATCP
ncbi:MAG: trypsin-like serine peptidase [Anaerolineales bacterium]